jgi:hypothetical protein
MSAALFHINHNILTDIITDFLQKEARIRQLIKYFCILKNLYTHVSQKGYCVLNVLIVNKIFWKLINCCKIKIKELQEEVIFMPKL